MKSNNPLNSFKLPNCYIINIFYYNINKVKTVVMTQGNTLLFGNLELKNFIKKLKLKDYIESYTKLIIISNIFDK